MEPYDYGYLSISSELFNCNDQHCPRNFFIKISFTTLTTTGYGDIAPANQLSRAFANLESIMGVMYPAILIARLVSIYSVTQEEKRLAEEEARILAHEEKSLAQEEARIALEKERLAVREERLAFEIEKQRSRRDERTD